MDKAAFLFLLATASQALNLATIDPCPACPAPAPHVAITITRQYQIVPTCTPSAVVTNGTTSTAYPCSASVFVSTVIPTISNGEQGNVTVTTTNQKVMFSATSSVETITSVGTHLPLLRRRFEPRAFGLLANGTNGTALPITQTSYKTHVIENCAPYYHLGPIAVPGWSGSGMCTTIGPDANGALTQTVDVTSCLDRTCTTFPETWVKSPVTTTLTKDITETITITKTIYPGASQAAVAPKPGMVQAVVSQPTSVPSSSMRFVAQPASKVGGSSMAQLPVFRNLSTAVAAPAAPSTPPAPSATSIAVYGPQSDSSSSLVIQTPLVPGSALPVAPTASTPCSETLSPSASFVASAVIPVSSAPSFVASAILPVYFTPSFAASPDVPVYSTPSFAAEAVSPSVPPSFFIGAVPASVSSPLPTSSSLIAPVSSLVPTTALTML